MGSQALAAAHTGVVGRMNLGAAVRALSVTRPWSFTLPSMESVAVMGGGSVRDDLCVKPPLLICFTTTDGILRLTRQFLSPHPFACSK